MKKFTYLLALVCLFAFNGLAFAQKAPINFETGGQGATWTWTTFENGDNPPLQIVANPSVSGINTSANVAKFTALKAGQPWAGCESKHGADIGAFTLTATNSTVKMMVYKSVISDVGIKFATPDGGSTGEIKVANTKINEWEELVFDFSGKINQPTSTGIDQIIFFPDYNLSGRAADNTVYLDNVTFSPKIAPPAEPTVAAPTPTIPAADVISLFSNAYTNVAVSTWSTDWDAADVADVKIANNDTKKYTNMTFAGIEFTAPTINAAAMTHFHLDIWTPDPTASAAFKIKLVDFGADGAFGGGNDVEHELVLTANSTPAIATGRWVGLDIPLSNFVGLTTKAHLAQLIIAGDLKTIFMDNIYFYKSAVSTEPTVAAPTPAIPAADVISLFSNAYTNVAVSTWSTDWDAADVADVEIANNDTKKYTNMTFAGIEFTVNATTMTHFHMDIWTPDPTAAPAVFKIKLVDFGADGVFGGGNDVEHELIFSASSVPALTTGNWVSFDIPLTNFAALTTKGHLAQLIIAGSLKTVFMDNVYFYKSSQPTEPTVAASTPTALPANVISLFSNAYTNVAVSTWSTDWDGANVTDVKVANNDTKKYTGMTFAAIEFTSPTINASMMTHFHMDIWTPDPTVAPAVFKIKLVDFGADGAFGGGNDVEHELVFTATSNPPLTTANWVSFNIPLSNFAGLTTKAHLAQLIISGDLKTVFVDNVYFHNTGTNAIEDNDDAVRSVYVLEQNYPNPFNPTTQIRFSLPEAAHVTLKVYNGAGQEVATLLNEFKNAGTFDVTFASDLPTGTYLYSLSAGSFTSVKKMMLLK